MVRPARSLATLRDQINKKFPYRDKASDGGLGDTAHAARKSDHNADANGIYHAYDFDHDPDTNGLDCRVLWTQLLASRDPRIKYVIFNKQIWFPGSAVKPYTGVNAHTHHLHLSVTAMRGDLPAVWSLPMLNGATTRSPQVVSVANVSRPLLYVKDPLMNSALIRSLQEFLVRVYPKYNKYTPTGNFGQLTADGIADFQRALGLLADGKVGPQTWDALGKAGFKG